MLSERRIIWSLESASKVQSIKNYLLEEWSEKEVNNFLLKLKKFEHRVTRFPTLYPASRKRAHLRKAVITKHQSVIYEVSDNAIKVITVLDHRQAP